MTRDFKSWNDWRCEIEPDLSAVIAADLAADRAGPVRIVFDTELDVPIHVGFAGTASNLYAVGFSHVIAKRFPVTKPGPTVMIATRSAEADFPFPDQRFQFAAAVAVHEVAHNFDHGSLRGYTPQYAVEAVREIALEGLQRDDGEVDEVIHRKCGISHSRFVRRTIHLASRMVNRGWIVPLIYLQNWGDVQPWDAFHALGAELQTLAGKTIREIDQIDPPAAFSALFANDASTEAAA